MNKSEGGSGPIILTDSPLLQPHINRPWFLAYVARRLGVSLPERNETRRSRQATVTDAQLARHAFLCGSTGAGKTRLLEHLAGEQLAAGCSVVLLDPKGETAERLLARAQAVGFPPERVTILDPRSGDGIPGWNPLAAGIPLAQAVRDFVAIIEQSATSWGPRLQDALINGLLLAGAHGLSVFEFARLLVRDDYRAALLRTPVDPADPAGFDEARAYFRDEFGVWSRSERAQAVSPVLNKIRELLRSSFLRPLLCARRNTLDLASLWRRPGLVIVRLDRPALGEEGTRLLAGLLVHALFRTSLRARGPVPVVLAIDELPVLERFVGSALAEIVAVARSQRLRLLVACQHLAQLSDGLRAALLANAAVQAFFRLGYADARLVAASLAAGTPPEVTRVVAAPEKVDRRTGLPERAEWRHTVRDAHGRPLRLDPRVWQRLYWDELFGSDPLADLQNLARRAGVSRLYVHAADTGAPIALGDYVAGLSRRDYWLDGPELRLVVAFPRPRLTGVERASESEASRAWTRRLQELPVQHAILRVPETEPDAVRVVDVDTPRLGHAQRERYRAAARAANGQSAAEARAALRWRQEQVERVAAGFLGLGEEVSDGSLI